MENVYIYTYNMAEVHHNVHFTLLNINIFKL